MPYLKPIIVTRKLRLFCRSSCPCGSFSILLYYHTFDWLYSVLKRMMVWIWSAVLILSVKRSSVTASFWLNEQLVNSAKCSPCPAGLNLHILFLFEQLSLFCGRFLPSVHLIRHSILVKTWYLHSDKLPTWGFNTRYMFCQLVQWLVSVVVSRTRNCSWV